MLKGQAVSKYLPLGISSQFGKNLSHSNNHYYSQKRNNNSLKNKAWNHAMNSLRQLRHRQCKKAKSNFAMLSAPITVKKDFSNST